MKTDFDIIAIALIIVLIIVIALALTAAFFIDNDNNVEVETDNQILAIDTEISDPNKIWQDEVVKPDHTWIEQYGYSDDSILAFNTRRLYAYAQYQQKQINKIAEWINSQPQWVFQDMNDPNNMRFRLIKDKVKIIESGNWSD